MVNQLLSIQQAGTEILGNNPGKLYIFCGPEYGIKHKYIEHMKQHYKAYIEMESLTDVIKSFSMKRLIPAQPKLYIVRYDDTFISALNEKMVAGLNTDKIIGTIVALYDNPKHTSKLDKFFPNNTVQFDVVHPNYIVKYLTQDYPELSLDVINAVVNLHPDYMASYNICHCLNMIPEYIKDHPNTIIHEIQTVFSSSGVVKGDKLRYAVAARNVSMCFAILDSTTDDYNGLYYVILSCMLELEKVLANPKCSSDLKKYAKAWDISSVYWMFQHTFNELERSRKILKYNAYDGISYLISLLQYNPIPTIGVI